MGLKEEILSLKKEENAIILAHNYQRLEVQEIADYTGDSLELARISARSEASIIVFCGVYFMAELAKILNPQRKVLLPVMDARCPMADMASPEQVLEMKRQHPDAAVCAYVNTNADVKAVSDIICTSANAVKVVESLPQQEVIFVPDMNLADWVARHTSKKIIPFKGYCYVHKRFKADWIREFLRSNPDFVFLAHPECDREVVDLAHQVLSTSGMLRFVASSSHSKFLIATEEGLVDRLKSLYPDREFRVAGQNCVCEDMKKITLRHIHRALLEEAPEIKLSPEIMERARAPIERMLAIK